MTERRSYIEKAELDGLPYIERIARVSKAAAEAIDDAFPGCYDTKDITIEPVSHQDGDWYLWIAAAKRLKSPGDKVRYAVWTLNVSLAGLYHGHYDIPRSALDQVFAEKRTACWAVEEPGA